MFVHISEYGIFMKYDIFEEGLGLNKVNKKQRESILSITEFHRIIELFVLMVCATFFPAKTVLHACFFLLETQLI